MINIETDCKLTRAEHVKPGDTVCFYMPSCNYRVTRVEHNCGPTGDLTRHYHGEDGSSDSWGRGALVYVLRA